MLKAETVHSTERTPAPTYRSRIAAEPAHINGRIRWHFIGPTGSKSLRTWSDKRTAINAGKREWRQA